VGLVLTIFVAGAWLWFGVKSVTSGSSKSIFVFLIVSKYILQWTDHDAHQKGLVIFVIFSLYYAFLFLVIISGSLILQATPC
jgi:hypothetical protein